MKKFYSIASGMLLTGLLFSAAIALNAEELQLRDMQRREAQGRAVRPGQVRSGTPVGGEWISSLNASDGIVNAGSSGAALGTGLGREASTSSPLYSKGSKSAYAGVYSIGLTTQSPGYVAAIPLQGSAPESYERIANMQGSLAKGAMNDETNWIQCFNPGGTTLMLFKYDMETWATAGPNYPPSGADNSYEIFDSAFDPIEGMVYGMTAKLTFGPSTSVTPQWARIDPKTGARTVIGNVTVSWRGIMCDASGQFYGIDADGTLYTIDKASGNSSRVGETGCASYYRTTGAIDPRTGEIVYATCNDDGSSLYRIDPTTAAAAKIYDFPQRVQLVNLFIALPAADDNAPDAPTGVTGEFENGSLSGTVNFTAPVMTYGGDSSHGDLFYYISANGQPIADGRTVYGAEVKHPVTLSENNNYVFEVYCTNSVGPGPKAKSGKMFIGNDVPTLGWTFTIEYTNERFNINWGAANATGLNGGAIDTDKVRYLLTRYPDGTQILTDPGVTSITDAYPEPEKGGIHYYTLQAVYNGVSSNDVRTSNKLLIGTIYPAYSNHFASNDDKIGFTSEALSGPNDWGVFSGTYRLGYNSQEGRDNYLYTPKMYLYANRYYRFSVKASMWMSTSQPDSFEVLYGEAPNHEAMTNTVLGHCDVTSSSQSRPNQFETLFVPEKDGYYYFGLHVTGPVNKVAFCFDDIEISAPVLGGAPEPVGNLKATPDPDGQLRAKVSFSAPKKNLLGQSLSQLTRVEIRKGDEVLADLPMTAETLSWTDKEASAGVNTYTVTPYNNDGSGTAISTSCFVGFDIPADVQTVEVAKGEADGSVVVTWQPVTDDIHGLKLKDVVYAVVRSSNGEETIISRNLTETTLTDRVTDGPQTMVYYGVKAVTAEGISSGWGISDQLLVGTPYDLPYEESITGGDPSHFLATRKNTTYGEWEIENDDSFSDIRSVDLDNGFLGYFSQYLDQNGDIFTGMIKMPDQLKNPTLSFYSYHFKDCTNTLEPMVKLADDISWRALDKVELKGETNCWMGHSYDLTPWLGKTVQIGFRASINSHILVAIDKIFVGSQPDHNIENVNITGPSTSELGAELAINVSYDVNARKDADNFRVVLMRDGTEIASTDIEKAMAGSHGVVTFTDIYPQIETNRVTYDAKVEYEADENQENNSALAMLTVKAIIPEWPIVENLTGGLDGRDVILSWDTPDMESRPWEEFTESFEGVTTGQDHFEGWTFVDADKAPIGTAGAPDGVFPGLIAGESKASFIGVNASDNTSMFGEAHSGDCFMGALYCYDRSVNDDWMISPELKGSAQTVSVWVRSMTDFYGGDRFEFLYSTSGTSLNDFISLGGYQGIPPRWVELKFDLPEGAKHFAIRCVSSYQLMFCVDDVTFIPADAEHIAMTHNGYNLWRDGVRVNETPLLTTEYVDKEAGTADHTYHVTAVYDLGESAPSKGVTVKPLGIGETVTAGATIYANGNQIVVEGIGEADKVAISRVDGTMVWRGNGESRVTVAEGIYIVRAGSQTTKIIVR